MTTQVRFFGRYDSQDIFAPIADRADRLMPRICYFYGIAVYMYYRDHAPPHFHAIYGEHEAEIEIANAAILDGKLPPKARALVLEWTNAHREDLLRDWDLARAGQPLEPIEPLQ